MVDYTPPPPPPAIIEYADKIKQYNANDQLIYLRKWGKYNIYLRYNPELEGRVIGPPQYILDYNNTIRRATIDETDDIYASRKVSSSDEQHH